MMMMIPSSVLNIATVLQLKALYNIEEKERDIIYLSNQVFHSILLRKSSVFCSWAFFMLLIQ